MVLNHAQHPVGPLSTLLALSAVRALQLGNFPTSLQTLFSRWLVNVVQVCRDPPKPDN